MGRLLALRGEHDVRRLQRRARNRNKGRLSTRPHPAPSPPVVRGKPATGLLGLVLLSLACGGCALAARDHACWPFVARAYGGNVPSDVTRTLARERGTRRQVGSQRAPIGYYWRKRRAAPLEVTEIRTLQHGYELATCPHGKLQPTGAALPRTN